MINVMVDEDLGLDGAGAEDEEGGDEDAEA